MKLTLMKLEERHKVLFEDMMKDWRDSGTKIYPGAIRKEYKHFSDLIDCLYNGEPEPGKVPSDTYVCMDDERGILVGAVSIRHYLNTPLLFSGGHIGDGVRPSERNKGIATRMIGMALEKCRERGIDRVLITCEKENIASARTIIKNGGVLENEVTEEDGTVIQRYWIENPCG